MRYPKLQIRSKNEFAKHLSHSGFSKDEALNLINDVLLNFDSYWKDSMRSEPEKNKYVRNASRTPLGNLLHRINQQVLAPHDALLPSFIFGGLKGLSHADATVHLLGNKRRRTLLKADISTFFEQISIERVYHLFLLKCGCSPKGSKLLSSMCCVPVGAKGSGSPRKTIGRGFATSSRLAVWSNLDTFIKLDRLVQKRLKDKDPRVIVYVDDIGITASNVTKEEMENLYVEIKALFLSDPNQPLPLKDSKMKIRSHREGMEILGSRLERNRISIGSKTHAKFDRAKAQIKANLSGHDRTRAIQKYKAFHNYKRYIDNK